MPSPREQIADNLAETCRFGGLDDAYGINKSKQTSSKGKTYWNVTFCKARYLDGEIKVFSERFIIVSWQTAFRQLPARGSEKFTSESAVKDFIGRNFINV